MKKLLITGTDTDVGKTWVSQVILKQLTAQQHQIGAYKPACSGAVLQPDGSLAWSDVDQLFSAINLGSKALVCPQTFNAAVAPNVAAQLEGRTVDDGLLRSGCAAWRPISDYLLIEGAGGLCCPLSNESSVADLAKDLDAPVVVVAANQLGVINHTLLTVEVAESRGIPVAAVILNDCQPNIPNDLSPSSNLGQLKRLLPSLAIVQCSYNANCITDTTCSDMIDWFA